MRTKWRAGQLALLAATSVALIAAGLPPSPQAAGIGDPLFPDLGNPGYDVRSYDPSLTYSGDHTSPVDTVTRIDATATSRLDTINLDYTHGTVHWVEVNGRRVHFASVGEDLETQTLPVFEENLFTRTDLPAWYVQSLMVHELSHQWFGDSVSPDRWSDVWLNEGHATWYETLYGEQQGGTTLDDRMLAAYQDSDAVRAAGGPPAAPKAPIPGVGLSLFRPNIYDGGALVLYALREEIGDRAFRRVEHDWVLEHRDGSATTADFVRLASRVAGRDLSGFLDGWLHSPTTPPMPGHPDWHTTPAT